MSGGPRAPRRRSRRHASDTSLCHRPRIRHVRDECTVPAPDRLAACRLRKQAAALHRAPGRRSRPAPSSVDEIAPAASRPSGERQRDCNGPRPPGTGVTFPSRSNQTSSGFSDALGGQVDNGAVLGQRDVRMEEVMVDSIQHGRGSDQPARAAGPAAQQIARRRLRTRGGRCVCSAPRRCCRLAAIAVACRSPGTAHRARFSRGLCLPPEGRCRAGSALAAKSARRRSDPERRLAWLCLRRPGIDHSSAFGKPVSNHDLVIRSPERNVEACPSARSRSESRLPIETLRRMRSSASPEGDPAAVG